MRVGYYRKTIRFLKDNLRWLRRFKVTLSDGTAIRCELWDGGYSVLLNPSVYRQGGIWGVAALGLVYPADSIKQVSVIRRLNKASAKRLILSGKFYGKCQVE